ncbi:MAG: hypothetical protein VKK80_15115 [Prochlorothrix sp.]|nr:hypothetical protein [Prochlorothrix sp.]
MAIPPLPALPPHLQDLNLDFTLPDPEDGDLSEQDFHHHIDQVWQVCDRFDLQTEIWRGRILRAVRDREKMGGDSRGIGFGNWLKEREITKSRAYSLIELANSADRLLDEGHLDPETINQFSKRAFVEASQSAPEVQELIGDAARHAAQEGKRINRQQVKQLSDDWMAMTSDLLPDVVREKAAHHELPSKHLAPLVREMEKLPASHQASIQAEVAQNPDLETLKQVTTEARYLAKYLEAAAHLRTLHDSDVQVEQALEEALRLDCLNLAADALAQAAQVEQAIAKFHSSWKRLGSLSDRLFVESGTSTPHLRSLLTALGPLMGDRVQLDLGEVQDGRRIYLQVTTEGEWGPEPSQSKAIGADPWSGKTLETTAIEPVPGSELEPIGAEEAPPW